MAPSKFHLARWVTCDDAKELARFIEANGHRVAYDAVDAPTFLATANAELTVTQELWPKVRFHALREHAGLVFQQRMEG
jgi:peptide chain release factor 3